jgi:hypothetical protein
MDYGDGKFKGEYQFNSQYRQSEICTTISSWIPPHAPYDHKCIFPIDGEPAVPHQQTNYEQSTLPVPEPPEICGNGKVGGDEDCDDTSSCCTALCKFRAGATCSPLSTCCENCKMLPSTTTCGTNGYCLQGHCIISNCSQFGLSFCGVSALNSCHQNCDYFNYCNDMGLTIAYSALTVADQVLCSADGRVCNGGQCTAAPSHRSKTTFWIPAQTEEAPRLVWRSGPTRSHCVSQNERYPWKCIAQSSESAVVLPVTYCAEIEKPIEKDYNCPAFWLVGNFSSCSRNCGGGVQDRDVDCVQQTNFSVVQVPESMCFGSKPTNRQVCNFEPCLDTAWVSSQWRNVRAHSMNLTDTTLAPKTWMQQRVVTCTDSLTGAQLGDSQCKRNVDKPAMQRLWIAPQYAWRFSCLAPPGELCSQPGNWTRCSQSCDAGLKFRQVDCIRTGTSIQELVVSDSQCSQPMPLTEEACEAFPCIKYEWSSSEWEECSQPCNGGQSSRLVNCVACDYNGNTCLPIADDLCFGSKPPSLRVCNEQPCATYEWHTGDWGGCSGACRLSLSLTRNKNTVSRSVQCWKVGSHTVVSDLFCNNQTRPLDAIPCPYEVLFESFFPFFRFLFSYSVSFFRFCLFFAVCFCFLCFVFSFFNSFFLICEFRTVVRFIGPSVIGNLVRKYAEVVFESENLPA